MMSNSETVAILSAAFRQLSDALHLASVACKDLEYTIPQLASSSPPSSVVPQTPQQQPPKKMKRVRQPNEPRRPPTAYLLFANEARAKLVKDGTELKPAELMTKLGAMWSELGDSKKRPYEEEAENLKQAYFKERDKYEQENPSAVKRRRPVSAAKPSLPDEKSLPSPAASPGIDGAAFNVEAPVATPAKASANDAVTATERSRSDRKDKDRAREKEKEKRKRRKSEGKSK